MADSVIVGGAEETSRIDTLSMYDDSEPNWNERLYFTRVEEKRGRTGWHIDMSAQDAQKKPLKTTRGPPHLGFAFGA
jgi:asparagine synthase (glutamine-hydrolysing)